MKPSDPKPAQPGPSTDPNRAAGAAAAVPDSQSVAGEEDPGSALDYDDFPDASDGSTAPAGDAGADSEDDAPPDPDLQAAGKRAASQHR